MKPHFCVDINSLYGAKEGHIYDPLQGWPSEHLDFLDISLSSFMSEEQIADFFTVLIDEKSSLYKGARVTYFVNQNLNLNPYLYNVRRAIVESGYLVALSNALYGGKESYIEFNFTAKTEVVAVGEDKRPVDIKAIRTKGYCLDCRAYEPPLFIGEDGFENAATLDEVAEIFEFNLLDAAHKRLLKKMNANLWGTLYVKDVDDDESEVMALRPRFYDDLGGVLKAETEVVPDNINAEADRLFNGPCVLVFKYRQGRRMHSRIAVVKEMGLFLLDASTTENFGCPLCFQPHEGISLDYLALCLYRDCSCYNDSSDRESTLLTKIRSIPLFNIEIAVNFDPMAQQKAVLSALNQNNTMGKANVLVVGDADLAADFDSIVCDLNLNILGTLDAADFDEDTIDEFKISADSAVDAVIVCADSYDVLKKIGRHRSSKALRDIMFFFLHNLEENAVESYIDAYDAEQDRTRFFTDVRLLLEKLRFEVSDSPTEEYLLRNSHKEEFSALELLDDDMIPVLLTSSLKAGEQSEQTLMLNFNTLRKILDSVFAEWRKLVPASVNSDAFSSLKLGAIVDLLKDERVVSERKTGYYLTTPGYMPNPLALSLRYLVDIANDDSHKSEIVRYMHATKRNNLYKSCVEILLDVLYWFKDVHDTEVPLQSFNLYEYSPIVEIDAEGIAHCGQVKLKGKDSTNVEVKAGDKVTIRTFAVNNDDKYMFYTTNYQIVR